MVDNSRKVVAEVTPYIRIDGEIRRQVEVGGRVRMRKIAEGIIGRGGIAPGLNRWSGLVASPEAALVLTVEDEMFQGRSVHAARDALGDITIQLQVRFGVEVGGNGRAESNPAVLVPSRV